MNTYEKEQTCFTILLEHKLISCDLTIINF